MKDTKDIINRVSTTRTALGDFYRKVYRLRRLVAGDVTALDDAGSEPDPSEDKRRPFIGAYPSILVKTIEEGRSNKLLQAIRTLAKQTVYYFPSIEFEDLEQEEAMVNAGYLKAILSAPPRGCGAVRHMKWSLYDYLTGGLGFNWIGVDKGRPFVRAVDTLNMSWDQTAPTLADARWMSCTVPGSLGQWEEMFGSRKFAKYVAKAQHDDPGMPIDLEFYYDLEDGGNYQVFFKDGDEDLNDEPVFKGKNPCYFEIDGERMPFLPFESMFFMELPSVGLPIGLTEQMLPSQIALWRVEKTIRDLVDLPSFYEIPEESFDSEEIQKFENAEVGTYVKRKKGANAGIDMKAAAPLPQTLVDWRQYHEQEMVAQSGANPYASGSPVEGTTYAAEVNAIQGAAGLMAGTISKDNADYWIRTIRKVLAKGKAYDQRPVTIYSEKIPYEFGPQFPIGEFLQPFAEIVINEDSMSFMPKEQRVAMAKDRLAVAISVAQLFPNAVAEEYRNYLEKVGEQAPDKYLQPPAQMPMMAPAAQAPA